MADGTRDLARVVETVTAPVEAVWRLISDFASPAVADGVERIEVTGEGPGAVRIVRGLGREIHERLVEADPQTFRFAYEMLPSGDMPLPGLDSYCALVVLRPLSSSSTQVEWSGRGTVSTDAAAISEVLNALYRRAIAKLRALVGSPRFTI